MEDKELEFYMMMFQAGKDLSDMYARYDGDEDWAEWLREVIPKTDIRSSVRERDERREAEILEHLRMECMNCGNQTIYLEASLRNFNTGMCGACGADALAVRFKTIEQSLKQSTENKEGV